MHRKDHAFARALARGDRTARAEFDIQYRPIVLEGLACAMSRWGSPSIVVEPRQWISRFLDNLLQPRRLRGYRGEISFGIWLFSCAVSHFKERLDALALQRRTDGTISRFPGTGPSCCTALTDALRRQVHALPALDRLYVRLLFVEGLDCDDLARVLGQGTLSIRLRKLRLLESLRRSLAKERSTSSIQPSLIESAAFERTEEA